MLVAVGRDDDVTCAGPHAITTLEQDPAGALRNDVEQDQPFRAGSQQPGEFVCRRLLRPALGELGPEKDRTVEAELFQRRVEWRRLGHQRGFQIGHEARSGGSIRIGGVAIIANHWLFIHSDLVTTTSTSRTA